MKQRTDPVRVGGGVGKARGQERLKDTGGYGRR